LRRDAIDLKVLAATLEQMPVRARGGEKRVTEKINSTREALRAAEHELWRELLAQSSWRSPLLIMDEAHHLKNPETSLARQLQSPDSDQDLRTGDGAMARAFDRMLFLTATPFQLGHHELEHHPSAAEGPRIEADAGVCAANFMSDLDGFVLEQLQS
jgi:superfamily II DNA or RNA helicase